jgi:hypothetical protein
MTFPYRPAEFSCKSELSYKADLGLKMGYPEESARKSAWQFMAKTGDPRLSMLHRFAVALEVPLADLIEDPPAKKR